MKIASAPVRAIAVALFTLISLASTSGASAALPEGLDVNDVTVLFPLGRDFFPAPKITLAALTAQGPLMDAGILSSVLTYGGENFNVTPPSNVRKFGEAENWVIVGFRYDPCASDDVIGLKKCTQELRLVAQPMPGFLGPGDSALHLTYVLGVGAPSPVSPGLGDLVELKQALIAASANHLSTSGQPLSVNPFLRAAVPDFVPNVRDPREAVVTGLYRDFIFRHATSSRLSLVTFMGVRDHRTTDWVFIGGRVTAGVWQPIQIPNIHRADAPAQRFDRSFFRTKNTETRIIPEIRASALSTAPFFLIPSTQIRDDAETHADFSRRAHQLENPRFANRNTTDCISCHTVTVARLHPSFRLASHVEGASTPFIRGITGIASMDVIQRHPTLWNLRSLGYFSGTPSLSARTVNESAAVAARINEVLGLPNPGKDCTEVQAKVAECLTTNLEGTGPFPDANRCLELCR